MSNALLADGVGITPRHHDRPPAQPPIEALATADAEVAGAAYASLGESGRETLQADYAALGREQRAEFNAQVASTLEGAQLADLRALLSEVVPVAAEEIDGAVNLHADAEVQADYAFAGAGIDAGAIDLLGLDAGDLADPAAVAETLNAIADAVDSGDFDEAVAQLAALSGIDATAATGALEQLVAGSTLPQPVKDLLLGDNTVLEDLAAAAGTGLAELLQGDFGGAVSALVGDMPLRDSLLAAVFESPAFADALSTFGITSAQALGNVGGRVLDALAAAADGDWGAAAATLVEAMEAENEFAGEVFAAVAQRIESLPQPIRDLFANEDFRTALSFIGTEALTALAEGRPLDALASIGDPELLGAVFDIVVAQEPLAGFIDGLGLDLEAIRASGDAIAPLLQALDQLREGRATEALQSLAGAVASGAPVVADIAAAIGAQLPGDSATAALVRSVLSDSALVTELLGNDDLHGALEQILRGDVVDGLQALGDNATAMAALAAHIAASQDPNTVRLRDTLAGLGFTTEADIATIGPVLADVLELGENLASGTGFDIAEALVSLGAIGRGLSAEVRGEILDRLLAPLADHLPQLSPELLELVKQTAIGLTDPAVAETFADAIRALPSDPAGFLQGIISTASALADNEEVALAMLNALGEIGDGQPREHGNIGALFADEDFNRTLVESGSLEAFFDGVEKIFVDGDLTGGIGELGGIITSLLTAGDSFEVGALGVNVDLLVGEEGLANMQALLDRIVQALPESARDSINEAVEAAVTRIATGSFPLTAIWNLGEQAIETASEWGDNSGFENALNVAQLVADAGSIVPGIGRVTAPLQLIIGFGEGLANAHEAVSSGLDLADALGVTG